MKDRYWLIKRNGVFYLQNSCTLKKESLKTRVRGEAEKICTARNEAANQPLLAAAMAKAYLFVKDPHLATRTWAEVMETLALNGQPQTQARCQREIRNRALNSLRGKPLVDTTADDFLSVLRHGGAMLNELLRRMQNLALGMGWLAWPVLPPKLWPKVQVRPKRGISRSEHEQIVAAEKNLERKLYYELLWEIGASQSDAARLTAENIDWRTRRLGYQRQKLGPDSKPAVISIGERLEQILRQLPTSGPLFPHISKLKDSNRSAEFYRRCKLLKISGVSLHSYRYAWAERAKECGYPERFAQVALGHNSRAVHAAYAKGAIPVCPPLEEYEKSLVRVEFKKAG
jgi:integrase